MIKRVRYKNKQTAKEKQTDDSYYVYPHKFPACHENFSFHYSINNRPGVLTRLQKQKPLQIIKN